MNKTDVIIHSARDVNRLLSMPIDARDLSWRLALERSNNALTDAFNMSVTSIRQRGDGE